ncbi:MAG: hypothetical protein HFG70_04300 [Hungatella sp.]|nr:hypothetical protein [Hungatella sp.]
MSVAEIEDKIPVVRARGTNYEIGFAHGSQAKKQVNITLANLKESVQNTVGLGWDTCVKIAGAFMPVIKKKVPEYLEEIRGIAEGSGNSFEDIFTLNCRTELGGQFACEFGINMERVRELTGDCSVIGITQSRTAGNTNLYSQNWDSSSSQIPTLIYMIVHQNDKPSIAWTGEAGLLCRMGGMNNCGIGLGGNTLSTNAPIDFEGMPLQFAYRRIMDQKTFADAVEAAVDSHVASNINLLVVGPEGEMVNIEVEYKGCKILNKKNGVISHANIYKHPKLPTAPYREKEYPKGVLRSFRLDTLVEELKGDELGVEDIKRIMTDHKNYPAGSICRHGEAVVTVFSAINDLNNLEMHLAIGNPCKGYCSAKPFEEKF